MRPLVPAPGLVNFAHPRGLFAADVYRGQIPEGATALEILRSVPTLPDVFYVRGVVCLCWVTDGEVHHQEVPREWWPYVRPRGTVEVLLYLPLGGGGAQGAGSSRKSTIALVATVALIAATTAISAGALGPAGLAIAGGYFAAGSTSAALLAGGVGLAFALGVAALTAPPVRRTDEDRREQGSAGAQGNVLAPNAVIPRVLGTHDYPPPMATYPLVELIGDDEVVECSFAMSGRHKWENIKTQGVPLTAVPDISYETREGALSDIPVTLVTRQSFTYPATLELSKHQVDMEDGKKLKTETAPPETTLPRWHTVTTRRGPDEAWFHLFFSEGILLDDPSKVPIVPIRIRARRRGTTTWLNFPELHFHWRGSSAFKKAVKFMWTTPGAVPTPKGAYAPIHAFKKVPVQSIAPIGLGGWTANSYFSAGTGDDLLAESTVSTTKVRHVHMYEDRVEFFLDETSTPFTQDAQTIWEVQFMRGMPYDAAEFDPSTYGYGGNILDFFGYLDIIVGPGSSFEIVTDMQNSRSQVIIGRAISVWNEYPFPQPGLAILAMKATNRTISDVVARLSSYIPDPVTEVISKNPAVQYRHVLLDTPLNAYPLPAALLDDLSDWRTRCITQDYQCSLVATGGKLSELLRLIASCGFARDRQSEKWGVAQDYPRGGESVAQLFSPRNMAGFYWEKALPPLPHALRVRFLDEDLDFEENFVTVYAQGYSADGLAPDTDVATLFEEVQYIGLTREDAVTHRAKFDLAQARLRGTFYHMETDPESLVVVKGDLVGIQHDTLMRQAGFARVKEKIIDSDGLVAGLTLDSKIPTRMGANFFGLENVFAEPNIFALTGTTGIAIRTRDGAGTVIRQELSNPLGYTDEVEFTTPFPDPGDELGDQCLVTSGEVGSEYIRALVFDVNPTEDLRASLTLVDEAPGVWPGGFDAGFDASFG